MQNRDLAADHVRRAQARLRALDTLFEAQSWADVVREAQELVELALKGLLRDSGVEPPRLHDVAEVLQAERQRLYRAMDTLLVRVETDAGIHGWGEGFGFTLAETTRDAVDRLIGPACIGQDATDIAALMRMLALRFHNF